VGAAGLILTQIMCVAMNRSLLNVLIGGYGGEASEHGEYEGVVSADAESAAMVLEAAQSVIIVPGYGLAAARAQNAVYEVANALKRQGADVRFAIHPMAGRMPGHMNVVLAEAEVPYEMLYEMSEINQDFVQTDVVIVVGANDVVNPLARTDPTSPIAGMPILDVEQANRVFVIKRSLSPGYAGIKNPLFERDNTVMLFGDAKQMLDDLASELLANVR
ncbi:MAG: NAD(P)(+) transhydrogenase (Re/Si-specific) subunit beta, partial [Nitriliruptoraceae bacterium]